MESEPARWSIRADQRAVLFRDDDGKEGALFAHVGDYYVLPRFDATAVRRDVDDFPTVEMEIEIEGGRPVITALSLRSDSSFIPGPEGRGWSPSDAPRRSRRPITAALLRELPLARLAKYAMLGVAFRLGRSAGEDVVPSEVRDDGFYEIGPDAFRDPEAYYRDDPDLPSTDYGPWSEPWIEPWTEEMQELAGEVERLRAPRRRNRIDDELLRRVAEVYRQAIEERRPPKKAVQHAFFVSEPTAGRYIMKARERGLLGPTSPGKKGESQARTASGQPRNDTRRDLRDSGGSGDERC